MGQREDGIGANSGPFSEQKSRGIKKGNFGKKEAAKIDVYARKKNKLEYVKKKTFERDL